MTGQAALPPRAPSLGLVECHACNAVCRLPPAAGLHAQPLGRCPRCRATLHRRKPQSIVRTWALLIAALILYVPANVLPVMYTTMLGRGGESTILGGVVDFWHEGAIDIAAIIFIASVAVPTTKFVVLGLLLVTVQRGSHWAPLARSRMYRLVELIGYWSMLDVVVVALVCALVQFDALGTAEPRLGIVFFGATVVLTMLAATTFDPRLIWDAEPADG
jgi:paraquat-inducible protein A